MNDAEDRYAPDIDTAYEQDLQAATCESGHRLCEPRVIPKPSGRRLCHAKDCPDKPDAIISAREYAKGRTFIPRRRW